MKMGYYRALEEQIKCQEHQTNCIHVGIWPVSSELLMTMQWALMMLSELAKAVQHRISWESLEGNPLQNQILNSIRDLDRKDIHTVILFKDLLSTLIWDAGMTLVHLDSGGVT
jgi:hypothetical protein